MAFKIVLFVCIAVQMACSQCLPISACQQQIFAPQPILTQQPLPQTTIIQDSSVSNNLANALQLLVVSSLLNNALPLNPNEVLLPGPCGPVLSPALPAAQIAPVAGPVSPCGAPYGAIGPLSPYGLLPEVLGSYGPVYSSVIGPQVLSAPGLPGCGCGGLSIY